MNWWKAHHDISTDRKYAVVQRRIKKIVTDSNALLTVTDRDHIVTEAHGVTRAEILAVWVFLIDFASQNPHRGSIEGLEVDEVAVSLDLSDDTVQSIIDGLKWKGMITGNLLTAFDKRQPINDRTGAERQKRLRDKKRATVTDSNALRDVTSLRNENSNGSNALPLAREDGDGDGDGIEVLRKEEVVLNPEVFKPDPSKTDGGVTERKKGESRLNGTEPRSVPSQSPSVSNSTTDQNFDPQKIDRMAGTIHAYMEMAGTVHERHFKAPDADIVKRCLVAVNGASLDEVGQFLHDRYANYEQSPRHSKGPKKYAWFETVLKSRFSPNGGHA